jgi:hypothetical protein
MWPLLKTRINLGFMVNPFYMFCMSFSLAIFLYLWGWCEIYPNFSAGLILFFTISFMFFIFAGYRFGKKKILLFNQNSFNPHLNDAIFGLIVFLGTINVIYMGYLPIIERSDEYKEFGMPIIDPVFNTMSIFFSVFYFQSFLEHKKKRYIIYVLIILIIQVLIFRRSTIVWIITSSSFLFLLYKQKINLIIISAALICIPFFSYGFGLYGNTRSSLTKSKVLNELGASDLFKGSEISHNHYMTYLYVSSPLANLQKNINEGNGFFNNGKVKDFLFYCLMPASVTIRLEKPLQLTSPVCSLITPGLIVGSFLMDGFFIKLCLYIIRKCDAFSATTLSILSTTVTLLIFSNFLNRLDVILMLFIYPVLFHIIFSRNNRIPRILLGFATAKQTTLNQK